MLTDTNIGAVADEFGLEAKKYMAFARAIEAAATAPLLERIAALEAQVEQAAQPVADPFTYVIQHLNSNPYALTKDECIEKIKELRMLYTSPPKAAPLTEAATDVLAERQRQISAEGWTTEHDDEHSNGELSRAAAFYALRTASQLSNHPRIAPRLALLAGGVWPWGNESQKPSTERRNLIKAGALILAEIDRLDRAAPQPKD